MSRRGSRRRARRSPPRRRSSSRPTNEPDRARRSTTAHLGQRHRRKPLPAHQEQRAGDGHVPKLDARGRRAARGRATQSTSPPSRNTSAAPASGGTVSTITFIAGIAEPQRDQQEEVRSGVAGRQRLRARVRMAVWLCRGTGLEPAIRSRHGVRRARRAACVRMVDWRRGVGAAAAWVGRDGRRHRSPPIPRQMGPIRGRRAKVRSSQTRPGRVAITTVPRRAGAPFRGRVGVGFPRPLGGMHAGSVYRVGEACSPAGWQRALPFRRTRRSSSRANQCAQRDLRRASSRVPSGDRAGFVSYRPPSFERRRPRGHGSLP